MPVAFSTDVVDRVWEKARVVPNYNGAEWRKDQCGAWISRVAYGNRQSPYGWEIDHIKPKADGGGDELSNLRPLQWDNNASKQENRLDCVVTSQGNQNVWR